MNLVLVIAVVVLGISATVSATVCPACDDGFKGFGKTPGKCGCCPWPCCCKCIPTTCEPSTSPMECACIDLTFLVDESGSIGSLAWSISNQFLVDIVKALEQFNPDCPNEIAVAPITFGNNATLHWNLMDPQNDDTASIIIGLQALPNQRGRTNLEEAVQVAVNEVYVGDNDNSKCANVIVILTDGKANVNEDRLPDRAEELKAVADQIFCIGVTNKIDLNQLLLFCDNVLDVNDFNELNQNILEFIRPPMLPTPAPCPVESCFCCCTPEQFWGGVKRY